MARFRTETISRRTVEALKTDRDTMFWDRELPGFGVRVHPSGRKVYVAQTRARGKAAKRVTVGVRRPHRRGGAAPGGADHRPDQGRRGAGVGTDGGEAGGGPTVRPCAGAARLTPPPMSALYGGSNHHNCSINGSLIYLTIYLRNTIFQPARNLLE